MRTLILFSAFCAILLCMLLFGWVQALRSLAPAQPVPPGAPDARSADGQIVATAISRDRTAGADAVVVSTPPDRRDAHGSQPRDGQIEPRGDVEIAGVASSRPTAAQRGETRWPDARAGTRRRLSDAVAVLRQDTYHPAALRDAIDACLELEAWEDALGYLRRAIAVEPDDADLYDNAATVALRLGLWLDALELLRERIRLWPEDARPRFNLAVAHQALGHLHDARVVWSEYLAIWPEDVEARFQRGVVLLDLRDWRAAADDFERILRVAPAHADALLNLLLAQHRMAVYERLVETVEDYLSRNGDNVAILNRAAEWLWSASAADGAARAELAGHVARYCDRSLSLEADQPDIARLRDAAAAIAR